ncbi:hypothetical protein C5167_045336 [Papaver somniferum]|uniref:Epidermal patterning factor-like protein n=1 Tax=Papaver somniferum TaxID=3469 RepID=A0A4Y7LD33_PAPSO|nr:hypothetical protein C5167_045336 [Papaver somniferum]
MDWEISNHRKILFFFFFLSASVISLYALFSTINTKTAPLGVTISAERNSDCYHFNQFDPTERQVHNRETANQQAVHIHSAPQQLGDDGVDDEDQILMINDDEEENDDEMIIATKSIVIRRSLLITSLARKRLRDGGSTVRSKKGFMMSLPGSSPPRCASKCGKCRPCKPVHVPVPPGTPVTTEYYPEAWRCKCGNKLYMP